MKKSLFLVYFILISLNVFAQNCNCDSLDPSQKKLYLNGDNYRLIDNALRCFKLTSIANYGDSIVRIWVLEDDYPTQPITWKVQLLEFGKNRDVPIANKYLLEWNFNDSDKSFPVKCIKKEKLVPTKGWLRFEKDIRQLNLLELYKKPYTNKGEQIVDDGMLIIQFLFETTTFTVDFTGLTDFRNSTKNSLRSKHSRKIKDLSFLINKHFAAKIDLN